MDEKYFARKIEEKWQRKWSAEGTFKAAPDTGKTKFYQLEMLPYPSGNLHMGHVRNYSVGDAVAWYKRLRGFNVLHPIGWDSFGQPAEDAAIKRGANPRQWTEDNIAVMRGQLERLGLSYDWERQIYAHRPEYYKFDQWFFLKMFEKGLAYKRMTQVNWCDHDQATLSNEQASGGICWRCGNPVTKKDLEQWFFKTTHYADALLDDMAEIESGWAERVLKRQRDWIGRSDGALVEFTLADTDIHITDSGSGGDGPGSRKPEFIRVFTTRIDTIFGVNAIVVAAEHPVIQRHISEFGSDVLEKIQQIRAEKMNPSAHDADAVKDGIDTGLRAINPFSGEEIPVWVGNYVMMEYGTGAVMSVPGHDERDLEFAEKFGLPVKRVIEPADGTETPLPFTEKGVLVDSAEWTGKASPDARLEMAVFAKDNGFGEGSTTYRLRDWGISRQRFWGSPIPIVYCPECGTVPVKYEDLPVRLPETAPFTGTGESPLAKVPEFFEVACPQCGGPGRRETDTMDTFVDSCWYYFRYIDPANPDLPFSPENAAYWTPVDQYIGGDDHAVMHLIYTRFWAKMMRDIGLVDFNEPVRSLLTQGMVVGETFFDDETGKRIYHAPGTVCVKRDAKGRITRAVSADGKPLKYAIERMSKSKGNGVDPDEMVDIYGADAARLFILFAAPIENELVWNESGVEGTLRFLQRFWRVIWKWKDAIANAPLTAGDGLSAESKKLRQKTHQVIKRVGESFESLQFNTPVAALMELSNALTEYPTDPAAAAADDIAVVREAAMALTLMLAPFAPHTAEEIFAVLIGNDRGILANDARFPEFNPQFAQAEEIEIPVQINGKLRSRVISPADAADDVLRELALADERVREHIAGKDIVKVVVVPKRLVNIVVKG